MTCIPRPAGRLLPTLASAVLTFVAGWTGPVRAEEPVNFNRDIRPILAKNCFACHGPDANQRKAELRLDQRENAIAELPDGAIAIVPGDPESSDLIFRVTEMDETVRMPPPKAGRPLSEREVKLLRAWIEQGAEYTPHWAFVPPRRLSLPEVKHPEWVRNGIDAWILARLESEGIEPAEEADSWTLLRRASLDLRGLPPSPPEMETFAADTAPGAFERAVDRFLEDPAFGERWARVWLDLARYADSAGYGSDPLRPDIYPYRDWVIDAFNRNLPYDQFTIEQLAGDMLPDATQAQKVATAFHRNTMTNTEGGTDDEEFRVAAIKDRADTTAQVWMGLTMGCAKCHTHKYDPISQKEYYQFYGIFNQTADADRGDESPTLPVPTAEQNAEIERIDAEIARLQDQLRQDTPELQAAQARWEAERKASSEWIFFKPESAIAASGASLETLDDGSLKASGENPKNDTYTLSAPAGPDGITAIRLEALPDPRLPKNGAGRADDGNFVLSQVVVSVEPTSSSALPAGRFVRVEVPGENKLLSLAEVQIFHDGENIAPKGAASQSSTAFDGVPERAIDGNTDGHYFNAKSTTHTGTESNPWWELNLAEPVSIERLTLWNRTDGGLGSRLVNFRVQVLDDDRKVVWQTDVAEPPSPSLDLSPSGIRTIALARAIADFSQGGFSVENLLKPSSPDKGWAVAPKQGEPHEAILVLKEPIQGKEPARLTIKLAHQFKDGGYNLGRFRLSVTTDPALPLRAGIPAETLAILDTPADQRTPEQRVALADYYRSVAPELQPTRDKIAALEKSKPSPPNVPVMAELPNDQRRQTHLMNKGNFLDPGETVEAAVPAFLNPLPEGATANRLGLARWLVDPANPLTARVAVNRYWARIFGIGLVETEEDFGTQGDLPSHPELLDWLATEYVRLGWDTKALLREIVTSSTYRQSSKARPELAERDPRNRLLAHAPRFRLEAEMVRDQALALSGLLSRKVHGPSVFPPQPEGLWQAAFNGQRTWSTSSGDDRHRRGLYTFWRRTVPYPSMATFDAPSREICAVRRVRTNTPLQAFVTLNDPAYVEAAQALGRRIVREGGDTTEDRVRYALNLCLCRPPSEEQVQVLAGLFESEREHYRANPEDAKALATEPIGPLPEGLDPAEMAAWTTVANVLLNLDGVLTKG